MAARTTDTFGELVGSPTYRDRPALRVATAGSVDDGKSTLIGRLLHDSRSLARDQLEQVERASKKRGHARTDLSLVTDGLRAEREQGITIDVAWRYFATAKRRFVLSDTPGHVQYTRNMVTGCSTADVAVVLVDARSGLKDQSRRHLAVAALLGVRAIIVCVNKMDLVGWDGARFAEVAEEARRAVSQLGDARVRVLAVPISALRGDNVVERSADMPFYAGPAVLPLLETLDSTEEDARAPARFPVQWVVRPQRDGFEDYRGYAGRLASGALRVGDPIRVLPAGTTATIARLEARGDEVLGIEAGASAIVHLDRDVDVSRGDLIVRADEPSPVTSGALEADVVWFSDAPARIGGAGYRLKHGTRTVRAKIDAATFRLDVATLERSPTDAITANDVARVRLTAAPALAWDPYAVSRVTGSFILIDEATGETAGAGMLRT